MQFLKSLLSMFSKSGGLDLSAEHMAFIEQLLAGDLDEAALQSMVMDYLGNKTAGDKEGLASILNTVIGDAEAQGDGQKLDLLNIVKNLI